MSRISRIVCVLTAVGFLSTVISSSVEAPSPDTFQTRWRDASGAVNALVADTGDSYFVGGNVGIGTSAPTHRLSVNPGSELGIGTSAPDAKLHVPGSALMGTNTAGAFRDPEHFAIPIDFAYLDDAGNNQSAVFVNKLTVASYKNDPADVRIRGAFPFANGVATDKNSPGQTVGAIHFDALTCLGGQCSGGYGTFKEGALVYSNVKETKSDNSLITRFGDSQHSMDLYVGTYPMDWGSNVVHRLRVAGDGTVQLGGGGFASTDSLPPGVATGNTTLTVWGGGISSRGVGQVEKPACSPVGEGSGTTHTYSVMAVAAGGARGPVSESVQCTNSASLSDSVYNRITWNRINGAEFYVIFKNGTSNTAIKALSAGFVCVGGGAEEHCQIGDGRVGDAFDTIAVRSEIYTFDDTGTGNYTYTGNATAPTFDETADIKTDTAIVFTGVTFDKLGSPSNGRVVFCTNCTKQTPCSSGGSGALAIRANGSWDCNP